MQGVSKKFNTFSPMHNTCVYIFHITSEVNKITYVKSLLFMVCRSRTPITSNTRCGLSMKAEIYFYNPVTPWSPYSVASTDSFSFMVLRRLWVM